MIVSNGATWDSIAFDAVGNEFQMDDIMAQNRRDHADVLIFEGGEQITIPDSSYQAAAIVEPPWIAK